ncbi:flagellar motor switch protein FliM [bacterium]|nr:flagellar motor switch protein FliM [bacterium]MBU1983820.1 flagellar motor switch protein FliM [bacterium]
MSKILTQEEIDALLKSVSAAQTYEPTVETKERSVHLYDFKHPDRISKDQLRALRTVHDSFSRSFGTYLSSMLRTLVDINLLSIDQATYSEYMLSLSVPSCIYIVASKNLKGSAIMEMSPQFALTVVDRLLGGTGNRVGSIRELTIIEQNILRKVVESALSILTDAWRHVYRMSLYIESFESNPQFVQIAPASETAAVVSFEIIIRDMTFPMNLCFPYFVLDPLIQNLSTSWSSVATKRKSAHELEGLQTRVRLTRLPVIAQLGSSRIPMKQLVRLRKGDVIRLDERRDEGLKIWVDGRVKFWGEPGISNLKKAVRIVRRVTALEEANLG